MGLDHAGLQLAVAGALVALTIYLGMKDYHLKSNSLYSFFLMDSEARAFYVGISYAATMISAFLFIGLPGLFYTHGVGVWLYVCLPVLFGVSSFVLYGRAIRRLQVEYKAISPYEIISKQYESKAVGAVSFLITFLFIAPIISLQVVSFGRLLEGYGVPYLITVFVISGVFIFYTISAGMLGDVKTDVFQAIVMVLGQIFVLFLIANKLQNIPHWWSNIDARLLSIPGPFGLFSAPGLLSVAIMMGLLPITHGHYIMRFMVAKDDKALSGGMKWAGLAIVMLYVPSAIVGILGTSIMPGLQSGDQLVGRLMSDPSSGFVGVVIGGIIISAIMSASLSSVDSQFLAIGASACRDLLQNGFGIDMTERQQFVVARLAMAFVGVGAILLALDPPALVVQLAVLSASGTMALVPTFLAGVLLDRRPPAMVALVSIAAGMAVFLWGVWWKGVASFGGWHPGILSLLAASIVYSFGLFVARSGVRH